MSKDPIEAYFMDAVRLQALIHTGEDVLAPKPTRRLCIQGCAYCERELLDGNRHFPPHDASPRCESGKRDHCSCDTCF